MIPTIGRTVLYVLKDSDVDAINRRRTNGSSIADRIKEDKWPLGAQAHIGNQVEAGQIYPMIITRVWSPGEEASMVQGQVFLDGNDALWTTSVHQDANKTPGTWHQPERV
jgi:hypothetical protein